MAISSVNANSINTAAYVAPQQDNSARQVEEAQQQQQVQETQAAQQSQSAPPPQESRPAANTQGQTTGRLVNETA